MVEQPGPSLFERNMSERLDAELIELAQKVLNTDNLHDLQQLFDLVKGFADHLRAKLVENDFPEEAAENQAWIVAWKRLRGQLDDSMGMTPGIASYISENIGKINPDFAVDNAGEPQDQATRVFYRTFIDKIESPGYSPNAAWLYEEA